MVIRNDNASREVTFVFVGTLDYRGRLLKEIRTLQKAGFVCRLVLGNIGEREVDAARYGFEIVEYRVPFAHGKVRYFLEQLWFAWRAGRWIAKSDADHVFCLGLEGALPGVVAKWLHPGIRLIFDSNELHLESMRSRIKRMVWAPLQALVIRSSDVILHAEPNRMEYFQRIHGGTDKMQAVIENFPHHQELPPKVRMVDGRIKVIYLGALGEDRYTHELIAAASAMEDMIELDLVGFATPEFMAELSRRYGSAPSPNVRILPAVAYDEIPGLLGNYQIGIALYKNTNLNNYLCAPNKVYDYLMVGMAVIANDYPGLRRVIEDGRLGACVKELDAGSLREAVGRIVRENRWANITEEVRMRYSWEHQERKLLALFDDKRESMLPTESSR